MTSFVIMLMLSVAMTTCVGLAHYMWVRRNGGKMFRVIVLKILGEGAFYGSLLFYGFQHRNYSRHHAGMHIEEIILASSILSMLATLALFVQVVIAPRDRL